jgi:hydrogenase/urease accessory protein HupE
MSVVRACLLSLAALVALVAPPLAHAHEARPAYLEVKETAPNRFDVLWRIPVLSGMRLPVALQMPAGMRNVEEPTVQDLGDSLLERRKVDAGSDGLAGKRIGFPGLQLTITDVLVRVELADGRTWTTVARPSQPWFEVAQARGTAATAWTFAIQGIEHILLGVDHLLFVLGLLFIVRTPWMLVKTITAFTVAHSITLAIATLGYASVPGPPLNAAIALSILFLGPEIVRAWRGQSSFTIRHPWVVAFAFGLLHGFGFASGLTAIGLPKNDIPLALLMFNVGVELGQLAFVALILLLHRAFEYLEMHWPRALKLVPAYVVGTLGAFWTIQRVVMMMTEAA